MCARLKTSINGIDELSLWEKLRFYGGRDELRQWWFYHVIDLQRLLNRGLLIVPVVVIQQIIAHRQLTSVQLILEITYN
jgi:hypothetical protein